MKLPIKNEIIFASVKNALGEPSIQSSVEYPDFKIRIKDPVVLRRINSVELRVLEVDENNKTMRVSFHAVDKFNPRVSTPRAIYITYLSMQNTVRHIFRNFL